VKGWPVEDTGQAPRDNPQSSANFYDSLGVESPFS